jgi:hypothetical protein
MKDKEFLEFLSQGQTPPALLKESARQESVLSFQGRAILRKFISLQVIGALLSLTFCPQFGLSFLVEGHGFTHALRSIGDWACAAFCGTLFLSMSVLMAYSLMKKSEFWWVWRRHKITLGLLPALFWGTLMLLNLSMSLPSEALSYHLVWLLGAGFIQLIGLKTLSSLYHPEVHLRA